MLERAASYDALCVGFRWDLPERLNMAAQACDDWAARAPDRVALIDLSGARRDVSYGELLSLSNDLAAHLHALGVGRGDRVGVYRKQSVWTAAAHLAIWRLGAISMPLFTLFGPEALRMRLADAAAVAVIADPESAGAVRALMPDLPALAHVVTPEAGVTGGSVAAVETGPEDPAVLIYTSGTTGAPKGALHGHRVLTGHLPGVEMSHDFLGAPGDVLWTPADWAWIGGLFDVLMPGLALGVPVVVSPNARFSGALAAEIVAKAGVRNVFLPPTALRMMKAEGTTISDLRSVASGGEPLGAEMRAWGRAALGVEINEFYGQTECNMVVSSCGALFSACDGAIGRAVPGFDVAVVDAHGRPVRDTEGDIAVRLGAASMMLEYWHKPAATAEKFRGDWLLTGDRGVETEGFIRFRGREDDVITSAGYRIGPAGIEDCLLTHPDVAAAAVIGKPDALRTEIVVAFVVLKPGAVAGDALADALMSHVKSRLAAHEAPREIVFVTELPMTVTGKIKRRDLKVRAMQESV